MPMFTQAIETRATKIAICMLGIILLPMIFVSAVHGLGFLYSSFTKPDLMGICLGLATILGLPGFFAAWYRVFKKNQSMSSKQISYTRFFLYCGIASSALLLGCVIYFNLGLFAIAFILLLILTGFAFVSATPKGI